MPTTDNFALKERPAAARGRLVRVHNSWLSVDPYMRGRMNDVKSYVPPFALDEPMEGGAVGEVVESRDRRTSSPATWCSTWRGWREEAVAPGADAQQAAADPGRRAAGFLGNLGLTGGTAYFGLLDAAPAKEGDIVFVSAAAGAVGSAVVQIAKAKGMTVIGSAGGADKCDFVRSLGADAASTTRPGRSSKQLAEAAPKGIDVYFDNVGGDHLDAALRRRPAERPLRDLRHDRGLQYGSTHAFRYIMRVIAMRIRLQGFIYTDYLGRMGDFYRDMGGWIAGGQVTVARDRASTASRRADAFLGLFSGGNTGKMLVRL